MSETIGWYWSRLKCMSVPEVLYRVEKTIVIKAQSTGLYHRKNRSKPDFNVKASHSVEACSESVLAEPYVKAAQRVIASRLDIFSLHDYSFSLEDGWNRDPLSGKMAPLFFGKTLNYRDTSLVGDIKYLWEANRHLHLVTLAQAYSLTEETCYLDALKLQLNSWFQQCPYLYGPNWTSSLELAVRLINWSMVWQLVGGKESPLFDGIEGQRLLHNWMSSVYQHLSFISGHLSKYSSANNHLIGELAGLTIATSVWPYWRNCKALQRRAMTSLEEQALLQNEIDGVNKEQAISYQQFVLDFLIIAGLVVRRKHQDFSASYWQRIETMMEYLAAIMDVGGNVPMIGDADDGYVVRLSQEPNFCPYRSLLATGALLFKRGDFKLKAGGLDDKTRWLLGGDADVQYEKIKMDLHPSAKRSFSSSGYYILGCDFEKKTELKLIVDAGPLGYQGIAAHGHADALAFTLSLGGREFLIDPGTYAYHAQKKWRDYFRGTSAHNTIRIDGLDQSSSGGNFMWLHKAQASCDYWDTKKDEDQFVGEHDGYLRLADPVLHQRTIHLSKRERKIRVKDFIACNQQHLVEGYWHFSEKCEVNIQSDGSLRVINDEQAMQIKMLEADDLQYELYSADDELPAGWISRRYDLKQPCCTVVWRASIVRDRNFVTEIICW